MIVGAYQPQEYDASEDFDLYARRQFTACLEAEDAGKSKDPDEWEGWYDGFQEHLYDQTHCQCGQCRCNNVTLTNHSVCDTCLKGIHDD